MEQSQEPKVEYELVKTVTGKPKKRQSPTINVYGTELRMPMPPNKNCKRCRGRGFVGLDTKTQQPIVCKKCYPML